MAWLTDGEVRGAESLAMEDSVQDFSREDYGVRDCGDDPGGGAADIFAGGADGGNDGRGDDKGGGKTILFAAFLFFAGDGSFHFSHISETSTGSWQACG